MSEFLKTLNAILWKSYWAPVPLQTLDGIKALPNEHAVKWLPRAPTAPQPYAHTPQEQGLMEAATAPAGALGGSIRTGREGPLWRHSSFMEMEHTSFKVQSEAWEGSRRVICYKANTAQTEKARKAHACHDLLRQHSSVQQS